MKGKFIIIRASGKIEATEITEQPGLAALQVAVGGYLETVPAFDKYDGQDCVAFCNEEGKLRKLPFNSKATLLWDEATGGAFDDILVGDVVIITGDDELLEAM